MKSTIKTAAWICAILLVSVSCYDDGTDCFDTATRISLYPDVEFFNADGTTASGNESFVSAVTVNVGPAVSDMAWEASVPASAAWATVRRTTVASIFEEATGGARHDLSADGIELVLQPNTEYRRTVSYPCYALTKEGTVAEIPTAETQLPAGPDIDIDGVRRFTVDFNAMTWSWERVTTPNCLPDAEVAAYPTKAYVTRDGGTKTWMTVGLHWAGDAPAEPEHPILRMQIQGICPYGWHIANFRDWYDLAYAALEASRGDGTYPVREEMLAIAKLVATNANNVAPWLRTQEGWTSTPARAAGADAFDFNLYPTGWRLNKNGYGQYGDTAHSWVPLIGSSAKKTWRLNNVKATSNYWFNDNLDAGNPAVGIRCVKNYKVKK